MSAVDLPVLWDHYVGETAKPGYKDGPVAEARFAQPRGIDIDGGGNIIVADYGNGVIRKISPDGQVSTIAGKAGAFGYQDGIGSAARFGALNALEIAPSGDIYVLDNQRIRKITTNGTVSTFAGGGSRSFINEGEAWSATSLALWDPSDLAIDSENNVYILAVPGFLKITPGRVATKLPTNWYSGFVTDLQFDEDGNLWAVESWDGTVERRAPDGTITSWGPGYGVSGALRLISAIAPQPNGEIWAALERSGKIGVLQGAGIAPEIVAEYDPIAGSPAGFRSPTSIVPAPQGGVYLADETSHSIQHVAPDGTVTVVAGHGLKLGFDGSRDNAAFVEPRSAVAPGNGYLYILDNWRMRRMDLQSGRIQSVANYEDVPFEPASGQFWDQFVVDPAGNFYFANFPLRCISKLSHEGEWSILAGEAQESGVRDGIGSDARFDNPRSICRDTEGNLYVVGGVSGRTVRRITPSGVVTTFAGSNESGSARVDGPVADARFSYIRCIQTSPDGGLWISEHGQLRHLSADGIVTTIAGDGSNAYPNGPDGQGSDAILSNINSIAVIDESQVLVSETNTSRVRRVRLDGRVDSVSIADRTSLHGGSGSIFSVAIDENGRHYAVDLNNRRIYIGMLHEDGGRLANLSVLKRVGGEDDSLTAGFVIEGDAPKPTLIRAVGPSLADHGITTGFMPDPTVGLFDRHGAVVENSNDWSGSDNIRSTMASVGAFALPSGSRDAALVRDISGGPATATVSAADGQAGQVLVEVYDADLDGDTRLTNLSTLTQVSPGEGRLIAGFVITGDASKTVLIRGVGPSLTGVGVPGGAVLPNPRIKLFRQSELIATNDDWNGAPLLAAAAVAVGAFPLIDEDSADAVLLIRLTPGVYSVHLESATSASGLAIAEVYEVK